MVTFLVIYIVGHLLSAVLIAIMLRRLRLIPLWTAWAFALTSPLTMAYFATHVIAVRYALRYVLCALWVVGVIPAASAMIRSDELGSAAGE